ncbi:hypothetical protein ACFLQN_01270 [Candidatus Aenigmatarchaeota archaeon]
MAASSVRNLIVGLIVLLIGIRVVFYFVQNILSQYEQPELPLQIFDLNMIEPFVNLFTWAFIVIIILLIPIYLYRRHKDKEAA